MATRIRAKSTVKLTSDSGMNATWEFSKGMPLIKMVRDLLYFNDVDVDEARELINKTLDEKADIKSK